MGADLPFQIVTWKEELLELPSSPSDAIYGTE